MIPSYGQIVPAVASFDVTGAVAALAVVVAGVMVGALAAQRAGSGSVVRSRAETLGSEPVRDAA